MARAPSTGGKVIVDDPQLKSDLEIVTDNIEDVRTVAQGLEDNIVQTNNAFEPEIRTVALDIEAVKSLAPVSVAMGLLADDISNIDLVATNLGAILNISTNMATMLLLQLRMDDLLAISGSLSNIDLVADNMDDVEAAVSGMPEITNVVAHMDDILASNAGLDATLKYLGAATSHPTERPDTTPLQDGDYYLNTVNDELTYYDLGDTTWFAVDPTEVVNAANAAAASETAAAISATNADTSETNAATSATTAGTSESNAGASAGAASTSESNAATSETNASNSETAASNSASAALASQTIADLSAEVAEDSAAISAANANYVGDWSDQTGALNIPTSVRHDDAVWMLAVNLADVTASEPTAVSPDWFLLGVIGEASPDADRLGGELPEFYAEQTDMDNVGGAITNVDNTSDANKPVSTAQQTALDLKANASQVLTDVPVGAVFTDNDTVYSHPAEHAISEVTNLQPTLDGKVDDAQVQTNVPAGAVFTDTVYSHPAFHVITDITGLQTALDGKVDDSQVLTNVPAGALFTDNNTTYSVGNGGLTQINFTSTLNTKLSGIATSANNYTHPSYNGDDFSVDSGALTGATVISDIDINVTTDSQGHVTDANGVIATRTLTLANLGFTGASNANYITNNNQLSNGAGYITSYVDTNTWRGIDETPVNGQTGESISSNWAFDHTASSTAHPRDTRSQVAGSYNFYTHPNYATTNINTSGATIIDFITTNSTGHIAGMGTRTLTAADLGAITTISSSQSSNGYFRLSNGLILQWGSLTAAYAGTAFTFPIAFPSLCASVMTTVHDDTLPFFISQVYASSTTGATIASAYTTGGGGNYPTKYIAIGY